MKGPLLSASGQEALVRDKLKDSTTADVIARFRERLSAAEKLDTVRLLEAPAAVSYWSCWNTLPINFPRQDIKRVPEADEVSQDEREASEARLVSMAEAGLDPWDREQSFWAELNQYLAYTYLRFKQTGHEPPGTGRRIQINLE
jgi:hypothetical protein